MSGPYGYGGYGGYAPPAQPGGAGYSYPPRPPGGFPPPGGPAPPRPGQYPPGQQPPGQFPPAYGARPPTGYRPQYPPGQPQQPAGYQGYHQAPGYGMPGYRPPTTQPQGYTPAVSQGYTAAPAYTPPVSGAPGYTPQNIPTSGAPGTSIPPMYRPPANRPAPPPPQRTTTRPNLPLVPDSFPELNQLSSDELEGLMDSETAQVQYFEGREDIKRLQEERKKVVERNEQMATSNLALKPQLEEKQQELIELYSELDAKRNELSDLQQQQQALADHYAPQNILARLKIAAADIEEESEAIAENFLNGDIPIEEFLKIYIPQKTLCHSRRAKEEKMERMGI